MADIEKVPSSEFTDRATEVLGRRLRARPTGKPYHLFLSGGSTPKAIFTGLAKAGLDWTDVHFWWGDERYVPYDHPDSNFLMAQESLLGPAKIPSDQIHRWPILASPELSAETYDREFRQYFEQRGETLHLQLLGMGDDGHTASLFPGSPALTEESEFCVPNVVPGKETTRLTLTFPALALSSEALFLVKGEGKATALKEVLEEKKHPASKVHGRTSTLFLVDDEAARLLS